MKHYVLAFDRSHGAVLERFDDCDRLTALDKRFELEAKYADHAQVEVVVLSARSASDIQATHSRYFENVDGLAKAVRRSVGYQHDHALGVA